jgi:pimeloyl-ACP methyl ester carboxylesterase
MDTLGLADGRILEFRVSGPPDGLPLVFHHGTPGTRPSRGLERAVHERGLRLVTISRPGYGGSTRRPGRAVVDVVADTAAVLRSIGASRCLIAGWSGGGPHALACAARLPGVIGALIIAGLAPADSLDFLAGMSPDNRDEWTAAFHGEAELRAYVEPVAPALMAEPSDDPEPGDELPAADTAGDERPAADVAGDELPAADVAALTGEFAEDLTAANRDGLRLGVDGWVDDELAFTKPWGFDPAEIDLPVTIWHGTEDRNVPFPHGRRLADHVRNASLHPADGEGHLSIMVGPIPRMLDELTAAG